MNDWRDTENFMNTFIINTPMGKRTIGVGEPSFLVAELSGNHGGIFDRAVELIHAAKDAGADAVKIQTYTPDTISINCDNKWFQVGGNDNPKAWEGRVMYDLYQEAHTPWEWQKELKRITEELGLVFFSMSVDTTGVDLLEELGVDLYKVGSYELVHLPLLERIGKTGKPVIMSVGYGSEEEIQEAVDILKQHGCPTVALLHCVTTYDQNTEDKDMHLSNIRALAERFSVVSGFSENAGDIDGAVRAVIAGASIIEKHLIMDRAQGGPDAKFSIQPDEFKNMATQIRDVEVSLGSVNFGPVNEKEAYNRDWCRPSVFIVKDVKAGEDFTQENVRVIRPGNGLAPKHIAEVIGKKATKDIERGTPASWEIIENV
jgi:pseudaminic acid synthase